MKKKLSALFMVFAMVLSLFSGLGVNTVWADDNEGGGTDNVITGLAAKDWFDYDDEGQVTKPKDQAEWSKELWSAVDGLILLVQKLENGVTTGSAINADALTLAYCGDEDKPDNNLQTGNVGSVSPVDYNNDYVQLKFTKTGWYKLYQTADASDAIVINVGYKELGFYTTETKTPESAMESAALYTFTPQDSNSIYLITNVPDDVTWDGSLKWEVNANGKNIDESQQGRYFEKTLITGTESSKDKTYKITLKKGTFDWMDIRVKATGTIGENGSEPWTPEEGITIHYDGNVVGFSVTQEFDWNDAAGCPVVRPDATYRKECWADFSHSAPYQFAEVNENGEVEKTYTKDQLTIEPMADGTGDAYLLQDKKVIRIKFNGVGTYKVYAKDDPADYVMISADFNKVGLYTSQTVSVDTACDSESTLWRDECNELYVIPHGLDDGVTPTYNFSVIPADSDQPIAYDGYYTVEDLQNGNHKIVINKDKNENFTVLVTMEWTENGNTEIAEASVWSENRGQEADETGFVAKADVDRENPQVPTDVNWYSGVGAYYTDDVCIVFADIDDEGKITYVTADQLSLIDENGKSVGSIKANAKNPNFCDLEFPETGNYKVVKKTDPKAVVNLKVYYREVAFYKNTTVSKESYLSSLATASDHEVFYMVENQGEDYIIKNVELHAGIYEDGKEEPTYFTDSTKYFTYEVVNASEPYVYKITLGAKADFPEEFFIEVKAQIQDAYGTYDTDGYVWIYTDKDSSDSGNTGGGSSGGSTGGGSTVTLTPTPNPGETTTETKTETTTNSKGNTVKQETTITKNPDGSVASTTTKSEIENIAKNTSASVSVTKDAEGKISAAEATVENTVKPGKSDTVKTTISASVVKQMTDAAGTTDLTIKQTVKDTKGNVLYTVETKAEDLAAGKKLTLVKIENGKKVLVSKPVTVNKNGNVSVKAEEGEYQLLNEKETKALQKEILKTVTPKTGNVSVDKGKKTTVKLSSKLDMDNVAKITYTSSDKSTVKVDKNGNIIAKKKGNVTVKVKVTLKDGTTKTVKVKVKVK